jgi:hypothetical protein
MLGSFVIMALKPWNDFGDSRYHYHTALSQYPIAIIRDLLFQAPSRGLDHIEGEISSPMGKSGPFEEKKVCTCPLAFPLVHGIPQLTSDSYLFLRK